MERRKLAWCNRAAVVVLSVALLAACDDDGTGPDGDLDPATAAAAMDEVVTRFIDDNQAVQSLGVFTNLIINAPIGPSIVPMSGMPEPGGGVVGWADKLRLGVAQFGGVDALASIPAGALGNTYVYNPDTEEYEVDESRTDAPENGVRFVLYAVDPILFEPIVSQEIGYIDVIDTSDFPTATISMVVVVDGETLIEMTVTGTGSETSADLSYSGYLSDGEDQLDFEIDAELAEGAVSLDFEASFGIYTVGLSVEGDESLQSGAFTASFADSDDEIVFHMSVQSDVIQDGSGVTINGESVAIISGTLESPTITNAEGEPLSEQELEALGMLFEGLGNVFGLFIELFFFGTFLLSLAFV